MLGLSGELSGRISGIQQEVREKSILLIETYLITLMIDFD
jgi:hypothetical protein